MSETRHDDFDECTCGHYYGEHAKDGCACVIVRANSETQCSCPAFVLVDAEPEDEGTFDAGRQ